MNSLKSYLLPIGVLLLVAGMVTAGVLLSKKEDVPVSLRGNEVEATDHTIGSANPEVTLIEYGDFQCPACAAMDPIVNRLVAENGDWLQFTFRHFPLKEIHRNAVKSSEAVEAATVQGKFWEMKEQVYAKQSEWSASVDPMPTFLSIARQLGLDEQKFVADIDSQDVRSRVESDSQTARTMGLNATPTFFVNGEKISNPPTYDKFLELLQSKRQK